MTSTFRYWVIMGSSGLIVVSNILHTNSISPLPSFYRMKRRGEKAIAEQQRKAHLNTSIHFLAETHKSFDTR